MPTLDQVLQQALWKDKTIARETLLRAGADVDTVPTADEVEQYSRRLLRNGRWVPSAEAAAALDLVIGVRPDPQNQPHSYQGGFLRGNAALPWRHFSRERIALQLIVRIADYRYIEQQHHSLCGPVTFMHDIAKRTPQAYAAYVIGLAENRRGPLGQMTVKVKSGSSLLGKRINSAPGSPRICEADYIALASLRDGSNILAYRSPFTHTMLEGATSPVDMVRWMRDTGYQHVEDHSHMGSWRLRGLLIKAHRTSVGQNAVGPHLNQMRHKRNAGHTVMMCAAGSLANMALGRSLRDDMTMRVFGGHFMLVNSVDVTANGAIFDLVTWGRDSSENRIEIPWSKLASWYGGFVSGLP